MRFGSEKRKVQEVEILKKNPGPGEYSLPDIIGKDGPSKSISPSKRFIPEIWDSVSLPGPGNYNPDASIILKKEPSFKLSTSKRHDVIFEKNKIQ